MTSHRDAQRPHIILRWCLTLVFRMKAVIHASEPLPGALPCTEDIWTRGNGNHSSPRSHLLVSRRGDDVRDFRPRRNALRHLQAKQQTRALRVSNALAAPRVLANPSI